MAHDTFDVLNYYNTLNNKKYTKLSEKYNIIEVDTIKNNLTR